MLLDCATLFTFDTLKLFAPPLFSALVAFMLFAMATRRDKRKDRKKLKKERLNKVRHFNYVAKEAIKTVEKQAQALREHLLAVAKNRFTPTPLSLYNKQSCEVLVDLISDETIFSSLTNIPLVNNEDVIQIFSKVSSKGVYINHQLESILNGVKDNFDYIHSQTKLIQTEVDELLRAVNSLSVSLQKEGFQVQEDQDFVAHTKQINDKLYSQEDQGLETFYNFFIMPLAEIVNHCRVHMFSNINGLLTVSRVRDRAERMYNELFGTHIAYQKLLAEEASKLQGECDNLKTLVAELEPRKKAVQSSDITR